VSTTRRLARIESAQKANPRDATLQYLAGMACMKRQLWGKAQQLLTQAALEGMVFYAQTGRCRWQVLLAHLEGEIGERCTTCDNSTRCTDTPGAGRLTANMCVTTVPAFTVPKSWVVSAGAGIA